MRNLICFYLGFSLLLLIAFFQSCSSSQKIEIPKPAETVAPQLPFEIPNSTINMSLSLTWNALSKQVNGLMPIQILEDKDFNKDGLKVHLKKTGEIGISFLMNQIQISVPLNAKVWYKYGLFGAYDVKEFRMQGTVYLLSQVVIEEMSIKSKTKIDRIVWEQNPTLIFYGNNIPMGFLIDPLISSQSSNIASSIDGSLKGLLDFKPIIKQEIQSFRDPILLSDEYKLWLKIMPNALISSPLRMNKEKISLDLSLKTKLKTILGKQPAKAPAFNDLTFKSDDPIVKETEIKLPVETDYQELSALLTKNLKGTPLYEGKKKVFLDSIQLWHSNAKLIIGVRTIGAVNGWIYLRGVPKFNELTSELYLDDLDFDINTKNVMVKSLSWMLSGKILKIFQENSKYSLKKDLDNLKKELDKQLDGYSPLESMVLRFKLKAFDFEQLYLSNDAIITIFDIRAMIQTEIG